MGLMMDTRTGKVIVHHQLHWRDEMRLVMAYLHLSFNSYIKRAILLVWKVALVSLPSLVIYLFPPFVGLVDLEAPRPTNIPSMTVPSR